MNRRWCSGVLAVWAVAALVSTLAFAFLGVTAWVPLRGTDIDGLRGFVIVVLHLGGLIVAAVGIVQCATAKP